MPALKNPSLIVLDNASYHNVKTEDMVYPNFSQKKAVLQNYLTQPTISKAENIASCINIPACKLAIVSVL
jgi:hypothetical protein